MESKLRARAIWNWISLSMPFAGFAAGFLAFGAHAEWGQGHPMDMARTGARVWAIGAVLGIAAAGLALVRAERSWGITAISLVLNLCVAAFAGWVGWGQW